MDCCRHCGGDASEKFSLRVLHKYDVRYFRCQSCLSLQTEAPYWLDEAYENNLSYLDTFAAQRTLNNLAASFAVAKCFRAVNLIDFGGSDGLLCRFLRDYGLNCFVTDKYAASKYAQRFEDPNFEKPDLTLAFEVLEHFPNPSADLDKVFDSRPEILLLSTMPYLGEGPSWDYLAPETGQHVFFFSPTALAMIAERRGYKAHFSGSYILLHTPAFQKRALIAKRLLHRHAIRAIRMLLNVVPASGVTADFNRLRSIDNERDAQ
jgi:hypothetical protein